MIKRKLIIGLMVVALIALISSVTTIVGFFIRDLELVLTSSKILSLCTLVLMTVFFKSVYNEMFGEDNVTEVHMTLKNKEDIESFKEQIEEELRKYSEQMEKQNKDKDE